jgi:ribosome-associated translation inhibitor RaiA
MERETRAGAEDYADNVFSHIESTLDSLNENVRRCRERLNNKAIR